MSAEKILDFPGELVSLSGTGSQRYRSNKNMLITKVPKDWQPEVEYKHKVSATYDQTLLLTQGGAFFQCGYNKQNQQGNSDTSNVTSLRDVTGDVKDIAGSVRTSWYVTRNGDLYGCGENNYGQQGANSTTTISVYTKRASNVKEALVNHFSDGEITCYVSINNELYMCGRNDFGQQGSGTVTGDSVNTQDNVQCITTFTKRASNVKEIYVSQCTTSYVDLDGVYWMCGRAEYGNQATSTTTPVTTFTPWCNLFIKGLND